MHIYIYTYALGMFCGDIMEYQDIYFAYHIISYSTCVFIDIFYVYIYIMEGYFFLHLFCFWFLASGFWFLVFGFWFLRFLVSGLYLLVYNSRIYIYIDAYTGISWDFLNHTKCGNSGFDTVMGR